MLEFGLIVYVILAVCCVLPLIAMANSDARQAEARAREREAEMRNTWPRMDHYDPDYEEFLNWKRNQKTNRKETEEYEEYRQYKDRKKYLEEKIDYTLSKMDDVNRFRR